MRVEVEALFLSICLIGASCASLKSINGTAAKEDDEQCLLYLAPSLISGAGMGVFAGKTFQQNEEIETTPSLVVESVIIQSLPAINYVYSSYNPSYAAYLIGSATMMNHISSPNTDRSMLNHRNIKMDVQSVSLRPFSTYHMFHYSAKSRISAGQEIFTNYGDLSWFTEREIPYDASASSSAENILGYTLEELKKIGHCLSDCVVGESKLSMGGKGLFTSKAVAAGGLACISPGLLVPQHRIRIEGVSSLLLNYLLVAPGADVALLPLGVGAMANHGGQRLANVRVVWYENVYVTEGAQSQASTLAEADPEVLVGREGHAVYFALEAVRALLPGEELLLDYGPEWEGEWQKYLMTLKFWIEIHGSEDVTLAPQFRHPIHVPPGFFPPSFYRRCVGLDCDRTSARSHSRVYHQARLNSKKSSRMTLESVEEASQQSLQRRGAGAGGGVGDEDASCRLLASGAAACGFMSQGTSCAAGFIAGIACCAVLFRYWLRAKSQRPVSRSD